MCEIFSTSAMVKNFNSIPIGQHQTLSSRERPGKGSSSQTIPLMTEYSPAHCFVYARLTINTSQEALLHLSSRSTASNKATESEHKRTQRLVFM